jgi:hypothetical protein
VKLNIFTSMGTEETHSNEIFILPMLHTSQLPSDQMVPLTAKITVIRDLVLMFWKDLLQPSSGQRRQRRQQIPPEH